MTLVIYLLKASTVSWINVPLSSRVDRNIHSKLLMTAAFRIETFSQESAVDSHKREHLMRAQSELLNYVCVMTIFVTQGWKDYRTVTQPFWTRHDHKLLIMNPSHNTSVKHRINLSGSWDNAHSQHLQYLDATKSSSKNVSLPLFERVVDARALQSVCSRMLYE